MIEVILSFTIGIAIGRIIYVLLTGEIVQAPICNECSGKIQENNEKQYCEWDWFEKDDPVEGNAAGYENCCTLVTGLGKPPLPDGYIYCPFCGKRIKENSNA